MTDPVPAPPSGSATEDGSVYLGPFSRIVDLSGPSWWGTTLVPEWNMQVGTARGVTARLFDARGRERLAVPDLADLMVAPDGAVYGVRLAGDGGSLTLFRQDPAAPLITPLVESAPTEVLVGARLAVLPDGRMIVGGANTGITWVGPLAQGQSLSSVLVGYDQSFMQPNGLAGMLASNGAAVTHTGWPLDSEHTSLPQTAPLFTETSDGWDSHRVAVVPVPQDAGWPSLSTTTRASAFWNGSFWVVIALTRRRVSANAISEWIIEEHLYRAAPGGPAEWVTEIGRSTQTDVGGVGVRALTGGMVRAPRPSDPDPWITPLPGGLWSGDRLVITTPRMTSVTDDQAAGSDGVLVIGADGVPVACPGPSGWLVAAAHWLGPAAPLSWLCALRDPDGGWHSGLTQDFVAWSIDPPGCPLPPTGWSTFARRLSAG